MKSISISIATLIAISAIPANAQAAPATGNPLPPCCSIQPSAASQSVSDQNRATRRLNRRHLYRYVRQTAAHAEDTSTPLMMPVDSALSICREWMPEARRRAFAGNLYRALTGIMTYGAMGAMTSVANLANPSMVDDLDNRIAGRCRVARRG